MNNFNFDNLPEIMSDEEFKIALENLMATKRNSKKERIFIVDPLRYEVFGSVLKIIKYWVRGTDAEVAYKLPNGCDNMAYITLIGSDLTISDTAVLAMIAKVVSVIDIYPKTDGRLQMDLVFYGLQNELE